MPDELREYFQDEDNCNSAIITARKAFGDTATTEEQYDQMEKTLGIMYMYCPEKLQYIVAATIHEAGRRRMHYMLLWNQQN